jgi:hypothetical protein
MEAMARCMVGIFKEGLEMMEILQVRNLQKHIF